MCVSKIPKNLAWVRPKICQISSTVQSILCRPANIMGMSKQSLVPGLDDGDIRRIFRAIVPSPRIERAEEPAMRLCDVVVSEVGEPSKEAYRLMDFILEGCGFKVAHDPEVFLSIDVPQIAGRLVVPKRVEYWEFHLAEIVLLQKPSLKRRDDAGPLKRS
jgi:hypothetical protein